MRPLALFLVSSLAVFTAMPQLPTTPFVPRTLKSAGLVLPYRLFVPSAAVRRDPLPLVVWLHGASGMGTDNRAQITDGGNDVGSRLWVRPDIQQKFPSIVAAPQMPVGQTWGSPTSPNPTAYGQLVLEMIDALAREFTIDRNRIYLVGQSMGGIGVWDLISKRSSVFAAAVPLCADWDPKRLGGAAGVKVWVFHGAQDIGMPVKNAREMVAALKAARGDVKYTEYPKVGHDVWTRAFAEPDLPAWLFAQRRPRESFSK